MTKFELEIRYNPMKFEVYLNYEMSGEKRRERVVVVESDHPSINIDDLLQFIIAKLKWLFTERDERFIKRKRRLQEDDKYKGN